MEDKWIDRITTLLLIMVPVVIGLQPQIMAIIPPQYTLLASFAFGALSQYASERRVNNADEGA
jgi:hypothetical protein